MSEWRSSDIRVGVIGMGRWGKKVIEAVASEAQLVACSNFSDPTAHDWLRVRWPDVEATFDVSRLLERDDIDAVVVASPIRTHVELALKCLAAGKHVLVEKPLATSLDDLERVEEVIHSSGQTLAVGYTLLNHEVAEEISGRVAGDPIVEINATWLKWGSFTESLLWNLLIHHVILWVALSDSAMSSSRWATAIGSSGISRLDRLEAHLVDDGFTARSHIDRCATSSLHCITIRTQTDQVLLWEGDRLFTAAGDVLTEVFSASEAALNRQIRSFLTAIKEGEPSDMAMTRAATHLLAQLEARITSERD